MFVVKILKINTYKTVRENDLTLIHSSHLRQDKELIMKRLAIWCGKVAGHGKIGLRKIIMCKRPLDYRPGTDKFLRYYEACLKNDFSLDEVQELISDPSLAQCLKCIAENIWHPTAEELEHYYSSNRITTDTQEITDDIDHHLQVDSCDVCSDAFAARMVETMMEE